MYVRDLLEILEEQGYVRIDYLVGPFRRWVVL